MSASSAEEFSGAMQAIDRAVIVGERSAGICVVADWMQLPNGATFMYPVEQTRTADGTVLEERGVIPDVEVALDRALLLQGVDSQLEAALTYLEQKAAVRFPKGLCPILSAYQAPCSGVVRHRCH